MRKILKVVGAIVGLLVVAVLGLLGFLIAKTPAQRPPTAEKIQVTPAMLARGDYLVNHVMPCLQCHSDHEESIYGMPLKQETRGRGGHAFGPDEGVPGFVQAQNITPDPETGKADWTDGEILRAMREGVSKDGHALFPMMPYPQFRIIGDDDAKAIVAYIRTLKPVHNVIKPRDLAFPVNLLVKNVPQPLAGPVVTPDDAKDHLGYGKYLSTVAGCVICHTPMGERGQRIQSREFAGSWEMKFTGGRVVTSNLTPAEGTWMSQASKDEFIGRFKSWGDMISAAATKGRNTTMPWESYAGMTDQDLGAIYDYLKTVPPQGGPINSFPDAPDLTEAVAAQ